MRSFITKSTAKQVAKTIPGCGACGLRPTIPQEGLNKAPVGLAGKGRKEILLVGEAVGASPRTILQNILMECGIDVDNDCWMIPAIACPVEKHSSIKPQQVEYCRPQFEKELSKITPKLVFLLGTEAIRCWFAHRCEFTISEYSWHGFVIPDYERSTYVVPLFSPMLLLEHKDKETFTLYRGLVKSEIKKGLSVLTNYTKPIDFLKEAISHCTILSESEAVEVLNRIRKTSGIVSFDTETTGLKPYADGHKIIVCSICTEQGDSYSFPITDKTLLPVKDILTNFNIGKVGHNLKYDASWFRQIYKVKVSPWTRDTMLTAHCLDNRPGITSLKFQTAMQWGVLNYSSIGNLSAVEEDKNDSNRILNIANLDRNNLMLYNALDSFFTMKLWQIQRLKEIALVSTFTPSKYMRNVDTFSQGVQFLLDLSRLFSDFEFNGAKIDTKYLNECDLLIGKDILKAQDIFSKTKLYKKWIKRFGVVDTGSPKQLRTMLYDILGYVATEFTDNDEESTDKVAMAAFGNPDLEKLIEIRELKMARGTFLAQLKREVTKGKIHALFNANNVVTFRSSSQKPNLQNQPIRNKKIGMYIRRAYLPRDPSYQIAEVDLKGAEVATAACYNKDRELIAYIKDSSLDMHRDMAIKLFMIKWEEMENKDEKKAIRHASKNKFVFPEFYGSNAENCSKALYLEAKRLTVDGIPMLQYLKRESIKTEADFMEHVRKQEEWFWYEKFSEYTEWKDNFWEEYLKRRYINTFTGFRLVAPMSKRQAINYPIQGDAFHIEAWVAMQLRNFLKKYRMKHVHLFNLVHDSLILDGPPDELFPTLTKLKRLVEIEVAEHWKWIIVPMTAEIEISPVGKSWYDKKPYELKGGVWTEVK